METVGCELVGRNIRSHVARLDRIGDEAADHLTKVAFSARDLLVPVEKRRKLGVVMAVRLMDDEGIRLEHS